MVEKRAKSVLSNKVGDGVANPFSSIRCPHGHHMFVLHHSCTFDVQYEFLFESVGELWVPQRKSSPNVDLFGPLRKMDTRPALQADGHGKVHDVLEWDFFIRRIVNVDTISQLSQQESELRVVEAGVGMVVASVGKRQLLNVVHLEGQVVVVP